VASVDPNFSRLQASSPAWLVVFALQLVYKDFSDVKVADRESTEPKAKS
jgi:hypothetical protein